MPPPEYRDLVFAMERLWLRERRLNQLTVSQEFRRIEIDISESEDDK